MRVAIPFLAAGLTELFEVSNAGSTPSGTILEWGAMMAGGETIDRIAALIESSRALSGVLALVLASTPPGELSANEMDALTDLSYEIHLHLDQLQKLWAQVSDELTKARN
jgi:hypothetical protein